MDVRKILEYALDREREGFAFFSEHAAKAKHASVVGVFKRLAEEEQAHIRYVERLIARQGGGSAPASDPALESLESLESLEPHDSSFFSERAASEMIEQTTIEAMVPDLPVLRMAFLIERDLAEFYDLHAAKAEGEARESLARLAAWEREHERLFKTLHDRVFAEYSGMPWGG
ncbi:MAG: ferritin family protein [Polyangia bacterium]|jgi:rubrerythrin|nr:ferritin family protein [Polyangia bacterium]